MIFGFFLGLIAYGLILKESTLRGPARIFALIGLVIHHAAAISNLYFIKLPGTGRDSVIFLSKAKLALSSGIDWSNFIGTGAHFYFNSLALLFKLSGPSDFAAFHSTILAFSLTLIVVSRITERCGFPSATPKVLLIFSLLPSSVAYGSTSLREVWQQLFFVTSCWMIVELQEKITPRQILGLLTSLILLSCLQKGLMAYSVVLLVVGSNFAASSIRSQEKRAASDPIFFVAKLIFVGLMVAVAFWGLSHAGKTSAVAGAFAGGDVVEFASNYRDHLNDARATYGGDLDTSSVASLAASVVSLLFLYQFSPLPWQITELVDIVSFGEILVRTILAIGGLAKFPSIPKSNRKKFAFLWVAFLLLDSMWAMGTANWGTAARHRTVGLPILCVLAAPLLGKSSENGAVETMPRLSLRDKIRQQRGLPYKERPLRKSRRIEQTRHRRQL